MANNEYEVVIVGGGAAGIAAARKLHDAGMAILLVEARPRLGGRAFPVDVMGYPLDLGCGWLHSADQNPWRQIAEAQRRSIDTTPPPWARPAVPAGFPPSDQEAFWKALQSFREKLDTFDERETDQAASTFLQPNGRWNQLINAVSTFFSGAELDRISTLDYARYADTGVNWRVVESYGRVIVDHAAGLPVRLDCAVRRIDHRQQRLRIETTDGDLLADRVIVTLPSNLIAENPSFFNPALPQKTEAAAGLPLGLADKLFLSLGEPEAFDADSRMFGRTDRSRTASYHFRPFGRPMIEVYFGGRLAADLEAAGEGAFLDFAVDELAHALGHEFSGKVKPLHIHRWGNDPFSRGSYSYALPGKADCRRTLAEPVEDRLYFAGEACSSNDFSTAHGAYLTGLAAATDILSARDGKRKR